MRAPDRALMCGPSTPFSHLEPRVRLIHLGSSPLFFRCPGLADSDLHAAFFGRRDSSFGLNRTVIMSTLLHPMPVAGSRVRPAELRWECGPPLGHVPRACSAGSAVFWKTYPKPPKAMVHKSAPRLHAPGISRAGQGSHGPSSPWGGCKPYLIRLACEPRLSDLSQQSGL